jgi:O-antigen ligase/tetratricopeptide (TPR) repeat protein
MLALVFALPSMMRREQPQVVPGAFFLLLFAVGWGVLQVVPLPTTVVSVLSPSAVELRAELLPEPDSADAVLMQEFDLPIDSRWQTLSLRSAATRQDLTWLAICTITFLLGWQLFSCTRAAIWLCGAIAANGAALALFGVIQALTWNGRLYWIGVEIASDAFASYGNRNNAAGYMCLCLGCALGFTLWLVSRNGSDRVGAGSYGGRGPQRSLRDRIVAVFAELDALKLAAFFWSACLIGAVFCTLSRGGGIAMLAAACFAALLVAFTRRGTGLAAGIVVALVAGLGLVAWVGMVDLLEARFLTLGDPDRLMAGGRVPNWKDALHAVPDFLWTGTGLNTYQDVYLMYQHRYAPGWYYFAENQYIQAVVEAGIVGLVAMVGALVLVTWSSLKLLLSPVGFSSGEGSQRQLRRIALGQMGLFVVASQAVHSITDFGLYLPANMLLMAVLCGAVTGAAAELPGGGRFRFGDWPVLSKWLPIVAAILLLGVVVPGALDFQRVSAVRDARRDSGFAQIPGGATEEQLQAAIAELSGLTRIRPNDAGLRYHLVRQWTQLYQQRRFDQLRRESPAEVSLDELWELASPYTLHKLVYRLVGEGNHDELARVRNDALVRELLRPALKELLLARAACPILAKVHLRLARLSVLVGDPADEIHLIRASRIEPSDGYTRTRAGRLHAQAGRPEQACRDWHEILAIDPGQLDYVLPWAFELLPNELIVEQMLPPDPRLMIELVVTRFQEPEHEELRNAVLDRAGRTVEQVELPDDEKAYLRGRVLSLQGRPADAIVHYLRAVELRLLETSWRYELALLLEEEGSLEKAEEHATLCVRLDPKNTAYSELLKRIIRSKLTRGGD